VSLSDKVSRLKSYPYTNTRVRAMRADLVTDGEYRKLTKMSLHEMAEFLSGRGYGDEIEELGDRYEGAELIERALTRNLSSTYMKLIRISPDTVEDLLWAYYRKFEIHNLKTILRKKQRNSDEAITDLLIPTPGMPRETLERYMATDSIEELLDMFTIQGFDDDLRELLDDAESLQEMEDTIDAYYYRSLEEAANEAGVSSQLFTRFLQIEAALVNITLILRMKRRGYSYAETEDRLVAMPDHLQLVDNEELVQTDSYEDALALLQETELGEQLPAGEASPAEISRALDMYKLEKGIQMLHTDQLSVTPILGYMICKEIEVSNLRMIVRAKEDDLGEEFIDRNLVEGVATA
jgi:V/A-type H+-transporting ATPase subunit C